MAAPDPAAVKAAADRAERKTGPHVRPRPSSIDLIPEEGQDVVVWAIGELNRRQRTAEDIRFEMNDKLAALGIGEISRSAFNRKALKVSRMASRLAEARAIFEGIAPEFTAERVDENTTVLGEFIKLVILELAQNEGDAIGPKGAMELAKAHLAVIQGQKISADRRRALEADFKAGASRALDRVAAAKGLSKDTAAELRRELFGLAPTAPETPAPEAVRGT